MSKQLRELADVHYGKSPAEVLSEDGLFPIVGTGGIYGRAKSALFSGPAVVVARKGSLGNPQFMNDPFWPVDTTYAVVPKTGIDAKWLYYNLDKYDLTKLNEATGVPSISRDWLCRISFDDPGSAQQRRIAEILSTLDEAIEQTEALIEKMQQVKAGLMHDLFTRGVTPDGRLRPTREQAPNLYKESSLGWIPKEWGAGRLDQYLDQQAGIKPGPFGSSLTKDSYVVSGFKVYGQEQVIAGSLEIGNYYISEMKFREMSTFEVLTDDVLISLVGTVGCVLVAKPPFERGIINPRLMRLRPAYGVVFPDFLKNLLLSANVRRQLDILAGGGTMPVINGKIVRRLVVPLLSYDEQVKVASRINALEEVISSTNESMAKLRQHKQGLMHDLLTGRIQVRQEGNRETA